MSRAARILLAPASLDYDPTEVAVPWAMLTAMGHEVSFATADAAPARPDDMMLTGRGLPLVGLVLRADARARRAHAALTADARFRAPLRFASASPDDFDALVLPGGHRARGIRPYLEDLELRRLVVAMFDAGKVVGAICHGTVVAARATRGDGRSVLHGRKTTSLTWAQERLATRIASVARFWDPHYYRTYVEEPGEPAGYRSVQAEVTRALAAPSDWRDVPEDDPDRRVKNDGLHRDAPDDERCAFVVRDGTYVSARWPGDAHTFAKAIDAALADVR